MPLCDSRKCGAPIIILPRPLTEKGRKKFVTVNATPEKRWVDLQGGAQILDVYTEHRATCVDLEGARPPR